MLQQFKMKIYQCQTLTQFQIQKTPKKKEQKQEIIQEQIKGQQLRKSYKLGQSEFGQQIKNRLNLRYFHLKIVNFIKQQQWHFKQIMQSDIMIWNQRLKLMKKVDIKQFDYGRVQNPSILISIQHIQFINLKFMNLYMCKIQNYESFSYLNCPYLEQLNLIYNNGTNFKSFSKMNTKSLNKLHLYMIGNSPNAYQRKKMQKSVQIKYLNRWNFNLQQLRLQKHERDSIIMPDLNQFSKCRIINEVFVGPISRIRQEKVVKTLGLHKRMRFIEFNMPNNTYQDLYTHLTN